MATGPSDSIDLLPGDGVSLGGITARTRKNIKDYLQLPALAGLTGGLDEADILDAVLKGCAASNIKLGTSTNCGSLREVLGTLTETLIGKLNAAEGGLGMKGEEKTGVGAAAAPTGIKVRAKKRRVAPTVCPIPTEIEQGWVRTEYARPGFPTLSEDYFERQNSLLSCGRHALNNLLGGVVFDASAARFDAGETYTFNPSNTIVQYPIDLHVLCRTVYPDISNASAGIEPFGEFCRREEHYDINLLTAALNMAGYAVTLGQTAILKNPSSSDYGSAVNQLLCEPSGTELKGFIFNIRRNHWVAVKKIGNIYRYLDSMADNRNSARLQPAYTQEQFLQSLTDPNVSQIIKVVLPAGSTFIDPRMLPRFSATKTPLALRKESEAEEMGRLKTQAIQALKGIGAALTEASMKTEFPEIERILTIAINKTETKEQNIQFLRFITDDRFTQAVLSNSTDAVNVRGLLATVAGNASGIATQTLQILRNALGGIPQPPVSPLQQGATPLFTIRIPFSLFASSSTTTPGGGGAGAGAGST